MPPKKRGRPKKNVSSANPIASEDLPPVTTANTGVQTNTTKPKTTGRKQSKTSVIQKEYLTQNDTENSRDCEKGDFGQVIKQEPVSPFNDEDNKSLKRTQKKKHNIAAEKLQEIISIDKTIKESNDKISVVIDNKQNIKKRKQHLDDDSDRELITKKLKVSKGEKRDRESIEEHSGNEKYEKSAKIAKQLEKPKLKQDVDIQPSSTIYISNLNDKIKIEKLRKALFLLFIAYGDIIEIEINWKNRKMRGQAFILFSNENEAKLAIRSLQNYVFFDKPLFINFSKHQIIAR